MTRNRNLMVATLLLLASCGGASARTLTPPNDKPPDCRTMLVAAKQTRVAMGSDNQWAMNNVERVAALCRAEGVFIDDLIAPSVGATTTTTAQTVPAGTTTSQSAPAPQALAITQVETAIATEAPSATVEREPVPVPVAQPAPAPVQATRTAAVEETPPVVETPVVAPPSAPKLAPEPAVALTPPVAKAKPVVLGPGRPCDEVTRANHWDCTAGADYSPS